MTAPPAWLIDTNIVSEMMHPQPESRVAAFLDSIADEGLGLASIAVWEILDGISRLDLLEPFEDLTYELFGVRVADWTLFHFLRTQSATDLQVVAS